MQQNCGVSVCGLMSPAPIEMTCSLTLCHQWTSCRRQHSVQPQTVCSHIKSRTICCSRTDVSAGKPPECSSTVFSFCITPRCMTSSPGWVTPHFDSNANWSPSIGHFGSIQEVRWRLGGWKVAGDFHPTEECVKLNITSVFLHIRIMRCRTQQCLSLVVTGNRWPGSAFFMAAQTFNSFLWNASALSFQSLQPEYFNYNRKTVGSRHW